MFFKTEMRRDLCKNRRFNFGVLKIVFKRLVNNNAYCPQNNRTRIKNHAWPFYGY